TGTISIENGRDGVLVYNNATSTRIGTDGTDNAYAQNERNVISGNFGRGIRVQNAHDTIIAGNFIGTDITGEIDLGNRNDGIFVFQGSDRTIIGTNSDGANDANEGNLIAGNDQYGIRSNGAGTDGTIIAGNLVGTNAAGTELIGNSNHAVALFNGPSGARIGTDGIGANNELERNIIVGLNDGVTIVNSNNNVVAGNYIGTDITGLQPLGNRLSGVAVYNNSSGNRVGTAGNGDKNPTERNIIAASGTYGVYIADSANNNIVAGNYVGTDKNGVAQLGSGIAGVILRNGAYANRVEDNLVRFSRQEGIRVVDGNTGANALRRNETSGNVGLGIDINSDGVTPNDVGDADSGPGGQLNFPVLSAEIVGPDLVVSGFAPAGSEIDFYKAALDSMGFGEGATFLVSRTEGDTTSGVADSDTTTGSYSLPRIGSDAN
ncbi:MAG: hypothetical protein D6800_01655, partial [Candidatus Zixiibacteriota bacterium]